MVLRLAEELEVPLRERNALLLIAGYAPVFPERSQNDVALAQAKNAIDTLLKAHEPFPALAVMRISMLSVKFPFRWSPARRSP